MVQKLLILFKAKLTLKDKAKMHWGFCLQSCDEWEIHSTQVENIQPMKCAKKLQLKFIPVKSKKGKSRYGPEAKERKGKR